MEARENNMVTKLSLKANVTFEEAQTALEKAGWDTLDALEALERAKKEREEKAKEEKKRITHEERKRELMKFLNTVFDWIKRGINCLCRNELKISSKNGTSLDMNLMVPTLLLIFFFPLTVISAIIAFFCGVRFTLTGPDVSKVQEALKTSPAAEEEKVNSGIQE